MGLRCLLAPVLLRRHHQVLRANRARGAGPFAALTVAAAVSDGVNVHLNLLRATDETTASPTLLVPLSTTPTLLLLHPTPRHCALNPR